MNVESGAGMHAVIGRYGRPVWDRIANWPLAAENHNAFIERLGGEPDPGYPEEMRAKSRRARNDVEYALEQARHVSRHMAEGIPDIAEMSVDARVKATLELEAEGRRRAQGEAPRGHVEREPEAIPPEARTRMQALIDRIAKEVGT